MDTNKIREALEIASFYKGSHTPASRSASARMTVVMNAEDFEKILSALAELDKAQQPAEPVACDYRRKECANDGAMVNGRWVCNNHATHPPQAAGLTVEGMIEVVDRWMREPNEDGDYFKRDNLRARLTAAIEAKQHLNP